MIEQTRPLRQYSINNLSLGGDGAQALAYYGGRLIIQSLASLYYVETAAGSGTYSVVTSPISSAVPDANDSKYLRTQEANGSIFISSALGFVKFDTAGSNPYRAGISRAPDPQLTLAAAGSLLASTNSVGYRVVFGLLDANKSLILGPPTGRVIFTATGAQDVTVKSFIPASITSAANGTSYFVQVYRTAVQTISGVDPGEEMQVAYQAGLTATDIANKYIQFTDNTSDGLRGAALYTNPSQQGIAQANYPPPIAEDVALFRGFSFYANTTQKHRAQLQLNGIGKNTLTITTAAGGITKSGGSGIATFLNAPDLTNIPTDGTAKISITGSTTPANNGEFPITAVVAATSITYTNAGAFTEPGTASSRAFPSKLTIAGVNYYGSLNGTETPASQIYSLSTAGTSSQNVQNSCYSLLRVVNQQAAPVVYGFYESGPDDGAGRMSFEALNLGAASFTISGAGTLFYNSFTPTIPTTNVITSANDAKINRLYYSKPNQPEHVPLAQYFDIGSQSKKILRIIPLREAMLVFKEDGLFRVSTDGNSISVGVFDQTVVLVAKSYACVSGTKAYALTTLGAMEITESAVSAIHDPIANTIRQYTDQYHDKSVRLNGSIWSNDSDKTISLSLSTTPGFRVLGSVFLYSISTRTWSQLPVSEVSGQVFYGTGAVTIGGIPYMMDLEDTNVWKDDFYVAPATGVLSVVAAKKPLPGHKVAINVTATGGGGSTITYTNGQLTGDPVVGSLVMNAGGAAGVSVAVVTAVSVVGPSTTLTLALALGSVTFPSQVGIMYWLYPQTTILEWVPFTAGDDGNYSRLREAAILLDGASTVTTATMNAYTEATSSTLISSMNSTNTPLPTGIATQTLFRSIVPLNMQQARRLSVIFQHNTVAEYVFVRGISYEYEPSVDAHEVT